MKGSDLVYRATLHDVDGRLLSIVECADRRVLRAICRAHGRRGVFKGMHYRRTVRRIPCWKGDQ